MSTKQETRIKQLQYLKTFQGEARHAANHRVFTSLTENDHVKNASSICCFISYQNEVDTHQFIQWCLDQKKAVSVPRMESGNIQLYKIAALSECAPRTKGILEPPSTNQQIDPATVEVFIVAGLAFDPNGYRLGYGQGNYDRLLKNLSGYKIGICYTNQIMFSLPHEDTDIPMDRVITDTIQISKM